MLAVPHAVLQFVIAVLHERLLGHASVVMPCAQLPLPSHFVLVVSVDPEHDISEQALPAAYFWQAPVPAAHIPSVPHDPAP
jgi:hypothetical protein